MLSHRLIHVIANVHLRTYPTLLIELGRSEAATGEKMSLESIGEGISDTVYWSDPIVDGASTVWIARVPFEGGMAEAGKMELTADSLVLTDYRIFEMHSRDNSTCGHYSLVGAHSPQTRDPYSSDSCECVVIIAANDEIVSSGPVSRLMLHWLAHGLLI